MISILPGVRVLVATKPVDFRKGAETLAAMAKQTLGQDPFAGTVLVFAPSAPIGSRSSLMTAAGSVFAGRP